MAFVSIRPLIYHSLLGTKVTLRIPREAPRHQEGAGPYLKPEERDNCSSSDAEKEVESDCKAPSDGSTGYLDTKAEPSNKETEVTASPPDRQHQTTSPEAQGTAEHNPNGDYQEVNILFNCGWSLDLNIEALNLLKKHLYDIDIIAITDGDFDHLGALPSIYTWLREERGEQNLPPVILTEGAHKFMRASLIEVHDNAVLSISFEEYDITALDLLYLACVPLRYHETYVFTKKSEERNIEIAFLPLNSGYSIGGTIWRLSVGSRNIVFAPHYRVTPVWYLSACEQQDIRKPDLFIGSGQEPEKAWPKFDHIRSCNNMSEILATISGTLRSHGSVLIPMDVGSSVIDLLLHLSSLWSNSDLQQFPIVLVSPIAVKLKLLYATCLEYMRESFCESFLKTMWNPMLNMQHVHPVSSIDELRSFSATPSVFITTCSSMTFGITGYLFAALSCFERNSIIFTSDSKEVLELLALYESCHEQEKYFNIDFLLRLNLEQLQEQEADMDHMDQRATNDHRERSERLGGSNHFREGSNIDYINRKSRNFVIINGVPTYTPPRKDADNMFNSERIPKNVMDYGIPYIPVSRADLEHNVRQMMPGMEPEEPQEDHDPEQEEVELPFYYDENPFVDYYQKHMCDTGIRSSSYEESLSERGDDPNAPRIVGRRFALSIRSSFYITRYFQQETTLTEFTTLLADIQPRSLTMLPRSSDLSNLRRLETLVFSATKHPGRYYSYEANMSATTTTKQEGLESFDQELLIPMDLRQEPVARSTDLILSLRTLCAKSSRYVQQPVPNSQKPRIERLMEIIRGIDNWKLAHNPQKTYQATFTINENNECDESNTENALKCDSFWSDPVVSTARLSLHGGNVQNKLDQNNCPGDGPDKETNGMDCDPPKGLYDSIAMNHSIDESLFLGAVPLATFVHFMDACMPGRVDVTAGIVNINRKVTVYKSETGYGVSRWKLRGTLDPAFYISRKMIRKLHNRIEPQYFSKPSG